MSRTACQAQNPVRGALKARADGAVYAGELQQLDDANWDSMVRDFFRK